MNANAVASHYSRLKPEERFRLILAAGARGDDAEQERLKAAARTITLSTSDHAPYARAFDELALVVFIELVDTAAEYLENLQRSDDAEDVGELETEHEPDDDEPRGDEGDDDKDELTEEPFNDELRSRPSWCRLLEIAYAAGYILRTKTDGWELFCERMSVPPFALWEGLPGYGRLQRALSLAEGTPDWPGAAFGPEGVIRWLNAIRPAGKPKIRELVATPDWYAKGLEEIYRERAAWWGG